MKLTFALILLITPGAFLHGQTKQYDIFSYTAPSGFVLKEQKQRLFYEKIEGNTFCQLYVWPAQQGSADPVANFKTDWSYFAAAPYNLNGEPAKQTEKQNGWDVITGVAQVTKDGLTFIITVSSFTQKNISWCAITIFNDQKYVEVIDQFLMNINADSKKFIPPKTNPALNPPSSAVTNNTGITLSTTNFDDGWKATPASDYVQVTRTGTEVRLYYVNNELDNARPNTTGVIEYYWANYITPYFNVPNPEKWSGVEYPIIYFMQGNATEKKTGKACFVALKVVHNGGARPIVVITSGQTLYQQQFPHPNDVDKMLYYNKFGVTVKDIIGTWNGGGGGGADYYNAYTGNYISTHTISASDEFVFMANGTYRSTYRSANINGGNAQFGGQDFKGNFSVKDWEVTATNRFGGKTTRFIAQLIAVKGGYLLYLEDPDYRSTNYTLYKTK